MNTKLRNVVPWRNPEEFKKVYKYLYDEDIAKKRWAADKVALWETRCWPTLPAAVDSTVAFVRTQIQDSLYQLDKSPCQAADIESMYASSIVRFVNSFVEDKEDYLELKSEDQRLTLRDWAMQKNIPTWIVDVRNNISHGRAPNLAILRMACSEILDYIEEVFWVPESQNVKSLVKTYDDVPIKKLLADYRRFSIDLIQNSNKLNKQNGTKQSLKNVLKKMKQFLNDHIGQHKFIENLVHPEYFVTKEDIDLIRTSDPAFLEETEKETEKETDGTIALPSVVKQIWNPMLELLHEHELVADFLESLLFSQEHRTIKIYQKVVDFYVLDIVDYIEPKEYMEENPFELKGVLISELCLLYACMKGASVYSRHVFDKMTGKLNLGDWKEELSVLLSMRRGLTVPTHIKEAPTSSKGQKKKCDITFTVGDCEEDIINEVTKRCPNRKKSPWCLAPVSINFSKVALGHVFNPKEKEEFEIECDKAKMEIANEEKKEVAAESAAMEESEPMEESQPEKHIFIKNTVYPSTPFFHFSVND